MPFNSDGTFTNVPGATTAQSGDVIRSSTWDSIHSDYGTAFGTIGQQLIQAPRTVSVAGAITALATDYIILISANVPTITLPLSSQRSFPLKIMGIVAGAFGTNNSVLTPTATEKISGLSTVTLNVDYQVITLYPLSSGGYIID